jgi:flavin-dependent dehydrogenase
MILPRVLLPLSLALTGALSASIPETDFDAIVVGGGPAGLSVLSGLSRVRRTAALFDSHQYRNDPTREMHDVIGNDGTSPQHLYHHHHAFCYDFNPGHEY